MNRRAYIRQELLALLQQGCPGFEVGPWVSEAPATPYLCVRLLKSFRKGEDEQSADQNNPHSGFVRKGQVVFHARLFISTTDRAGAESEMDDAIERVDMAMEQLPSLEVDPLITDQYTLTIDSMAVGEELVAELAEMGIGELAGVISYTQIFK